MPSHQDLTPVTVVTRSRRYAGSIASRGRRIAEVLNDQSTGLLEMRDTLARSAGIGSEEMRFDRLCLNKRSIFLAIPQGPHEAPIRRMDNYATRDRYGAMLTLPGYILSGILHLSPHATPSPMALLAENTTLPSFMALTNVTVHSAVDDLLPSRCPVAIVRRQLVEAVQLSPKRLPGSAGHAAEVPSAARSACLEETTP